MTDSEPTRTGTIQAVLVCYDLQLSQARKKAPPYLLDLAFALCHVAIIWPQILDHLKSFVNPPELLLICLKWLD